MKKNFRDKFIEHNILHDTESYLDLGKRIRRISKKLKKEFGELGPTISIKLPGNPSCG